MERLARRRVRRRRRLHEPTANDVTYVKYGNLSAAFSISTGSADPLPTGVELPPPTKAFNLTFDVADGRVVGSDDPDIPGTRGRAFFRYEVDNSTYDSTGVIRIRSTGRVGDATRPVIVTCRQEGFIDYVWFTDYEFGDPMFNSGTCSAVPPRAWNWAVVRAGA